MSGHQAQVPPSVALYYGWDAIHEHGHPTVAQTFTPGPRGWKNYPGVKRVNATWARKASAAGVTHVAVRCGGRVADFSIRDLLSREVAT